MASAVGDYSSSGTDSDSDAAGATTGALEDSIFGSYLRTSAAADGLSKVRSFLLSSRSGGLSCLICLERIRPSHPTWSCSSSCFALFHLLCVQSWATQSSAASAARTADTSWHCPKCRFQYPRSATPRSYLCFCGKVDDPAPDPWIFPHSCGEICGRPLAGDDSGGGEGGDCGHRCLLLCHPGPCPPCPQLVSARCFCGGREDVRRCNLKGFSCARVCSRVLPCGRHECPEICHPGPCPPCKVRDRLRCLCGAAEEVRECCGGEFRCGGECGRLFRCGKHACERGCHGGACGECPLQGKRCCPCGKVEYEGMACDVSPPTCGSTCEKMLPCGLHRCPERCHRGRCVETCRTVVMKACRCRSLKKEVPCYQDLVCERKCQRGRDCGRHACRRRCCDGECPPCPEICGRKLRCNNHKCPSPCHRGACAPCPVVVTISCACGETHFDVPCGAEAGQKPPRCPKPCRILPLCGHGSKCKPHRCHYGACLPCQLSCEVQLSCGHKCNQRCHGAKPAPNPDFTLKPKKLKPNQQPKDQPGTPCPPCQEIVSRSCVGQHLGAERMMLCSDRRTFSCSNLCGSLLQCGNHYCQKPCHSFKTGDSGDFTGFCDECELPCQKERIPVCQHPCPLPCHLGDCPPCKVLVKRSCHCGSMVHVFECSFYNRLPELDKERIRSCGGPCHRKLQNCWHLCPEICHPGECPSPEKCNKKVWVRCQCSSMKKEWLCQEVQASYVHTGRHPSDVTKTQYGAGLLPCSSQCAKKLKISHSELQQRKSTVIVDHQITDVETMPKKKRRRERVQEKQATHSRLQIIISSLWRYIIFLLIVMACIAAIYFGYKGLFWLSDWMNELEDKKMKRSYTKF